MNAVLVTDEMLMAWVDGELDPGTEATVAAAVAVDESLAARAELFRHTGEIVRQALAAELEEPVPETLMASVRAAVEASEPPVDQPHPAPRDTAPVRTPVVDVVHRPRMLRAMNGPGFAIAASIVACVAGLLGYAVGTRNNDASTSVTLAVSGGMPPTRALENLLAKSPGGAPKALDENLQGEVLATFRDGTGSLCREFRVARRESGVLGVACRDVHGAWSVRYAQAFTSTVDKFQPAASAPGLDLWLESIGASEPLTGAAEVEALALE